MIFSKWLDCAGKKRFSDYLLFRNSAELLELESFLEAEATVLLQLLPAFAVSCRGCGLLGLVMVEGIKMKTKPVPKRKLADTWRTLSTKPMPKIKALRLSDQDFNHTIQRRRCINDDLLEIEEWGRILSLNGTDACVFNAEEVDNAEFVILIRQNPYHTLAEIIQHELAHIARGDL